MADTENRSTHRVYEKEKLGEVQIADEVVAIIAGLAATEVEGVDSMAGNITNELVGKLGMKNLSKGVERTIENVGRLGKEGMRETNEEIIKIMIGE